MTPFVNSIEDIIIVFKYKFRVQYYFDNEFCDKLDVDLRVDVIKKDEELEEIKSEIEDIYNDIKRIDIRYRNNKKQMRALGLDRPVLSSLAVNYNISSSSAKATISYESRENIIDYFNSIEIKLYEEFFNLRGLMIKKSIRPLDREELVGSEQLKKKYLLLKELEEKVDYINKYEDIRAYFDYLSNYKILPLSIKNIYRRYLEDITLDIKIPKNLQILNEGNIEIPDEFVIEDVTGILDELLCGIEDSNIKEFSRKRRVYDPFPYMKSKAERFIEFIGDKFEYKTFDNEKEYIILQCNFKELNPHNAMYLPMNLMIKSNDEFEIEYAIKCKNMSKIQTGKIKA